MGPTLHNLGALLWVYVVMGEYVVYAHLSEMLALLVVVSVVAVNWRSSIRHLPLSGRWRRLLPLGLGLAIGFCVVMIASSVGSSGRSEGAGMTVGLWLLSVVFFFVGRYLSAAPKVPQTGLARVWPIAVWIGIIVVTGIALSAAASRM